MLSKRLTTAWLMSAEAPHAGGPGDRGLEFGTSADSGADSDAPFCSAQDRLAGILRVAGGS